MITLMRASSRCALVLVGAVATLSLAGCGSQPATSTAEQNKAFGGDPAMKAKMGAAVRDKALQAAPQSANPAGNAAAAKAKEEARVGAGQTPAAR